MFVCVEMHFHILGIPDCFEHSAAYTHKDSFSNFDGFQYPRFAWEE